MPPPETSISRRFSLFGIGESSKREDLKNSTERKMEELTPFLKLETDKNVYRPGDEVLITIEVQNPNDPSNSHEITSSSERSLLLEKLNFELKGVEKLDTQWFTTQKPLPGTKLRKGEHVFLDCSTTSLVSNQIISSGTTKKYLVRTVLPSILPPSYRGTTIRYLYYVRSALSGQWLILENGHSEKDLAQNITGLEVRVPLQIWVTQKASGILEEGQIEGVDLIETSPTDIYWKEMDGDSEWVRANDLYDGVEEGYDSSRDEILSVSSYNPSRDSFQKTFGSSLSLQGSASRSFREPLPAEADEVLHNSSGDILSSKSPPPVISPQLQRGYSKTFVRDEDEKGASSPIGMTESIASEGYIRGRSYNIKLDDQVLLRFSPKKSDSNYYFSDMIGGTLTFFHEEGQRRCLEVSITLEISETINRRFVHPSRRNSPKLTKVQSDHHEVVADMVQTSFLFSIPMDGPMSFSTPHVSVQWALRFEFFTTPRNIDWSRYGHPLLVEGRDKCEWFLPINVHAPPPGAAAAHARSRKNLSREPFWVRD
ncbi:uncharacterized protein LOC104902585 [Beta vulgaris subsp. vulgaris]|uniref:uncharacterized protein LOC104902585 n=1 Tax=Beta vulgaris subsp. vulgaris TaxID=3555 RepID=UPI0020367BD1|nr:uncharacterized protein LOC104902585 [Beta vulgaris subsp. vulgaris]XP_010688708.2 uncharacterized protein LOC104902585 [Beta vulgaris subsp. vulgaris]